MEVNLNEIPDWLVTSLIAFVGFAAWWVYRDRHGIGEAQLAKAKAEAVTADEQQKVIALQERQIELLNSEVSALRRRVDHLEQVIEDYKKEGSR